MSDTAVPERPSTAAVALSPRAIQWLASLDARVRPRILPGLYIRIVNSIADRWSEPDLMRSYFDELMVDRRGDRAGFPDDILMELGTLKHYYDKEMFPIKEDVWTKIWSAMG